ncbi:MAG: hypothetical protein R3F65_04260 [bacterium]
MSDAIDTHDDDLAAVKKPRWPWLIVIALLAVGGWFGWQAWRATDPQTVLVAVDVEGQWYEGSQAAAWFADEMNAGLEELGFTVVRAADPAVVEALEGAEGDLDAAARAVGAGFVIGGAIAFEVIEHPAGKGYFEVRARGNVEVSHVDDEDAPAGGADAAPVRGWAGARTREAAVERALRRSLYPVAAGEVLPRLLAHPVLAGRLSGDAATASSLRPASQFVERRTRLLAEAETEAAKMTARRQAAEKGPAPVTYHGSAEADDGLCGVGPDGICVRTDTVRRLLPPGASSLWLQNTLETVERRRADGTRDVLWEGYNIYGYPRVSLDGRHIGFVEDVFGWAKVPVLIAAGGAPKRLVIDPERRFSTVTPAPGGESVAMWARPGRDGDDGLLVLDANGNVRLEIPAAGGQFNDFAWTFPDQLVVLHTPPPPETEPPPAGYDAAAQTVWRQPAFGGPPTAIYTVGEGEYLSWMAVAPGSKQVIFRRRHPETGGLGLLDLETGVMTPIPLAGDVLAPAFDATGERVTFTIEPPGTGGDEEVAIIELAADEPATTLRVLTDNPWRDRYPQFDPSGERIWFEQLGRDPLDKKRSTSLIASVPIASGER